MGSQETGTEKRDNLIDTGKRREAAMMVRTRKEAISNPGKAALIFETILKNENTVDKTKSLHHGRGRTGKEKY